ncbi:MAG: ABC transporter substrate-binding protein [Oscillospiraceae bacterium]|nr:ABC transporter substrate-binding protein [Oscillospiraceae bacterium]
MFGINGFAIVEHKKTKRLIAVCSAFVLFAGIIAVGLVSCRDGSGRIGDTEQQGETAGNRETINWASTVQFDPPEVSYLTEVIDFSDLSTDEYEIDALNCVLAGDLIYFTSPVSREKILSNGHSERKVKPQDAHIFSLNINTMKVTKLPDYTPTAYIDDTPSIDEVKIDFSFINPMCIDSDGNIVLIERIIVNSYDVPGIDLSDENINLWDYHTRATSFFYIRKLDSTGADLSEPSTISDMPAENNLSGIFDIAADEQGNIYIKYGTMSGYVVYVYDSDGKMLFTINENGWNGWKLRRLPNGNVAAYWWHVHERELREIDVKNEKWGEKIKLFPDTRITITPVILPGNEEFPLILSDDTSILGFNPETNETMEILNRIEAGILSGYFISVVTVLDDGRILVVGESWDNAENTSNTQITIFTKISFEELQNRTILTLAALNVDSEVSKTVSDFNAASSTHYIQIIDYSVHAGQGPDGWMAALDQLSLDITTGKIPDMLAASGLMPLHRYAPIGLLEDLYPFLDNDPNHSRDSFVNGVLSGIETNGKLYRIFPSFGIMTIIGNPYFLGDYPGWTMDEFQTVLQTNPQADVPLGSYATRDMFFNHNFIMFNERFVDWEAGTADFDNEVFASFLESIAKLPAETGRDMNIYDDSDLIATGRQIMREIYFMNFEQYQVYKTVFGGDIVFKGYPTDNRKGSALYIGSYSGGVAMTVTCTDKGAAWEFIRTFLQEDWQRKNVNPLLALPANEAVFESRLNKAMEEFSSPRTMSWQEFTVPVTPLTEEDAEKIREMIANSVNSSGWDTHLWNIVSEEASKFFNGIGTAQDAARIIQSRAAILMSEQAG